MIGAPECVRSDDENAVMGQGQAEEGGHDVELRPQPMAQPWDGAIPAKPTDPGSDKELVGRVGAVLRVVADPNVSLSLARERQILGVVSTDLQKKIIADIRLDIFTQVSCNTKHKTHNTRGALPMVGQGHCFAAPNEEAMYLTPHLVALWQSSPPGVGPTEGHPRAARTQEGRAE